MSEQTTQQEHASVPDIDALVASDRQRYRVLSNGAVMDMQNGGKFVAMDASKNPHAITKENSQDMHVRRSMGRIDRVLRSQSDARKGVCLHLDKPTFSAAWAELVGDQADVAHAKGNRSTEAARFVGEATGAMTKINNQAQIQPGTVNINVFTPALGERVLRALGDDGVIDAQYDTLDEE